MVTKGLNGDNSESRISSAGAATVWHVASMLGSENGSRFGVACRIMVLLESQSETMAKWWTALSLHNKKLLEFNQGQTQGHCGGSM